MTVTHSKMTRATIATQVYENITFIQEQTKAFCDWARRYRDALRDMVWYFEKGKPLPDGYGTAGAADCLYLNEDERNGIPWRPYPMPEVNPLGLFTMQQCAELPWRTLTGDEQLMSACVILAQVYEKESFGAYCVDKSRAFPPASEWKGIFDLGRWRMWLGSRLAQPDGDLMIQMAWDRVKACLPKNDKKPLPTGAAMIYEKLRSLEPHKAMIFPDIQKWYEKETEKNLDEGTWKRWRPELEAHGMTNRANVGYYVDPAKK
jgi:hypothetical protein